MTAVIRACVAGVMAGVVLLTTCAVTGPSVAAAQQAVPPPATNAPPPPAAPVPAEVQPVQPPPDAPQTTGAPPAEVAPPLPTEAAPPVLESPAPVVAPPPSDAALQVAPEPSMEAAEAPSKVPSYVLWGTGAASLVIGAVFGGLALAAKKDYDDNPSSDRADTVDHRALVADVAFGLGIVLAVTGTVFFFAHDDQPAQQTQNATDHKVQLSVAPLVSPHAGGGALQVRF